MFYIVFTRSVTSNGSSVKIGYRDFNKSEAMAKISGPNGLLNNLFGVSTPATNLYFIGFDKDLDFIDSLRDTSAAHSTIVNIALRNISSATFVNTFTTSGYKHKLATSHECECTDCDNKAEIRNAYGEYLCADHWAEYMAGKRGLVEYYIGIANGEYYKNAFSEDDLKDIEDSWTQNKASLNTSIINPTVVEDNYNKATAPEEPENPEAPVSAPETEEPSTEIPDESVE